MAAARRTDIEAMASMPPKETCVVLRLEFPDEPSRKDLEDYAILVQEATDEHAADAAPGAAIRCAYEPMAIEVIFTIENESVAEVHHRVASVVAAIEDALPFTFDTETATRSADRRELVPA
jgi:sorbitol-specific phosphotransferase system component IIA